MNKDKSLLQARGGRVRKLRGLTGLSRKVLGEKAGISQSALKFWEDARAGGLTEKGAKKLIKACKEQGVFASVVWLLHGVGMRPQCIDDIYEGRKPDLEKIVHLFDENVRLDDEQAMQHEIELFQGGQDNRVVINIIDKSMEPFYDFGDVVGGKRFPAEFAPHLVGERCIVEIRDGLTICRRVEKGSEEGLYNLMSSNAQASSGPSIIEDVEIVSLAPILWHRKRDKFNVLGTHVSDGSTTTSNDVAINMQTSTEENIC